MITIDEAIIHAKEKAEDNRKYAKECEEYANRKIDKFMRLDKIHQKDMQSCIKCAEEHEQLAEWLEELKALREVRELWEYNNNLAYQQGRNDAIDEFAEKLRLDCLDSCYHETHMFHILDVAKKMKAGE